MRANGFLKVTNDVLKSGFLMGKNIGNFKLYRDIHDGSLWI